MSHASLRRFVPGAANVQRKRQLQQMTAAQELAAMRTALRVGRGVRGVGLCQVKAWQADSSPMPVSGSKLLESAALFLTVLPYRILPCFLSSLMQTSDVRVLHMPSLAPHQVII